VRRYRSGPPRVAVVGGGYAGMAAAVELVDLGVPATVYEAAASLGGRARRVSRHGVMLDNGQHILIGAYTQTLALIERVGSDERHVLRLPLQWRFPPHFDLRAFAAPAPWHLALGLLGARGLSMSARIRCARFLQWCKRVQFRLPADTCVADLLVQHRQDSDAIRFLWDPLCVAALNTPPQEASARVFLSVLRDGLASTRAASELILPRTDLTSLFPEPAAEYVRRHGGEMRLGCAVQRIDHDADGFRLRCTTDEQCYDAVIIATAPSQVAPLAGHLPQLGAQLQQIAALDYQPIVTLYLHYPELPALPFPMMGMSGEFGQWLFDRSAISGQQGLLAVVISARGRAQRLKREDLAARVQAEVSALLPGIGSPDWVQVIEEKRATFACVPNLDRPASQTGLRGLYLAGDYTASDYPATIEAAVRSGRCCARLAHDEAAAAPSREHPPRTELASPAPPLAPGSH